MPHDAARIGARATAKPDDGDLSYAPA